MLKIYSLRNNGPMKVVQVEIFDKHLPDQVDKEKMDLTSDKYDPDYRPPVYDMFPCITLVAQLSDFNDHVIALNAGCKMSVLPSQLSMEIHDFISFLELPYLESRINRRLDQYGSLFEPAHDTGSGTSE